MSPWVTNSPREESWLSEREEGTRYFSKTPSRGDCWIVFFKFKIEALNVWRQRRTCVLIPFVLISCHFTFTDLNNFQHVVSWKMKKFKKKGAKKKENEREKNLKGVWEIVRPFTWSPPTSAKKLIQISKRCQKFHDTISWVSNSSQIEFKIKLGRVSWGILLLNPLTLPLPLAFSTILIVANMHL